MARQSMHPQHRDAIDTAVKALSPETSLTDQIEALLRQAVGLLGEKMPGASYRDLVAGARTLGALLAYLGGTGGKKETIEDFLRWLDSEERSRNHDPSEDYT